MKNYHGICVIVMIKLMIMIVIKDTVIQEVEGDVHHHANLLQKVMDCIIIIIPRMAVHVANSISSIHPAVDNLHLMVVTMMTITTTTILQLHHPFGTIWMIPLVILFKCHKIHQWVVIIIS